MSLYLIGSLIIFVEVFLFSGFGNALKINNDFIKSSLYRIKIILLTLSLIASDRALALIGISLYRDYI